MTFDALAAFLEHLMAGDLDLIVEVNAPDTPQLVVKSESASNDKDTKIRLERFRTRAWRLANDTALKLGWFEMS
jgi:hypothetical protein